jgi:tetratricopeptide (TPR) repeat protein
MATVNSELTNILYKTIRAEYDLSSLTHGIDSKPHSADEREVPHLLRERFQGLADRFDVAISGDTATITWSINKSPEKAESLNSEALSLARHKELARAIDLWLSAIEINPNDPDYQYNAGLAFFELKEYGKGLDRCIETLRICPVYHRAYFVLGSIYSKMRQFDKAETNLKLGLNFNKNNILALVNLGAVHSIQKKYTEAIIAFERAISLDNKEARAYLGLGKIYGLQNDHENALRCFKAVVKMNPDGKLGTMATQAMRAVQVEMPDIVENGERIDPQKADAVYAKGFQAFLQNDYTEAIKTYKQYLLVRSHDAEVWAALASCQLRVGQKEEAIVSIDKAIAQQSNKAAFYKQAAIINDACGKLDAAGAAAQKAYDLGKRDSITLTLLGKYLFKSGQFQEAARHFREALKMHPGNINARYHLAQLLKATGQVELAKQQFEEIVWTRNASPLKEKAKKELEMLS